MHYIYTQNICTYICVCVYIYISVIWRQTWFWRILMDVLYASTEIKYGTLLALARSLLWLLYPVLTYIFKKDCVKLEANPRNSHKNNYWDSGGKVYDESWEVELLGLEKTGIKYQIFEGEKNQLFSILQKPKQDLSWAQACPAAREECVSAQGALDWKRDYVQGWVMQGESPWRVVIWFSPTAPTSIVLSVMLPFRASQVPAIQQAFHASMIQCHLFSPHMSYLFYSPHLRSLRHKSTVQAPLLCESSPHTAFLLLPLMNSTPLWLLMVLDNEHIIRAFFHLLNVSWMPGLSPEPGSKLPMEQDPALHKTQIHTV